MNDLQDDDGYRVGNKCPPREYQFKPGQSGNRGGRPRGATGLRNRIARELQKTVTVHKNGKPVRMKKEEVVAKQLVDKSMQGDTKIAALLIKLVDELQARTPTPQKDGSAFLPDRDALIRIARRLSRHLDQNSGSEGSE